MRTLMTLGLAFAPLFTGCASIVGGQLQTITVEAEHDDKMLQGATCSLTNDKGKWYVTTPGSTLVQRSFQDLALQCDKPPIEPGTVTARSGVKPMMFGNILFGGVIGAGIDHASGAAYEYAPLIRVVMGRALVQEAPPPPPPPARADCVPGATPTPCSLPAAQAAPPMAAASRAASCVPGNPSTECSVLAPRSGAGSTQTGRSN